ncbi:MAG: YihY/virulence factor BrkB family protein [Candidatus Hydrogenedentota bacterium]|nr:MAG: YihY/virulence factor BrkB family protein [Candidatus Hydrogenedentota bacterium]
MLSSSIVDRTSLLKNLFRSIFSQFMQNNGFLLAGAMSFYILFAIIPFITLFYTVTGWIVPPEILAKTLLQLKDFLPSQMQLEFIKSVEILKAIRTGFTITSLFQSIIATVFIVWVASLIFDVMERSLCVTFHVKKPRPVWKSKLTHFLLMLSLALLFIATTTLSLVTQMMSSVLRSSIPWLLDFLGEDSILLPFFRFVSNLVYSGILFFILYKSSTPAKLKKRSYIYGSFFAAFFWAVAKFLFGFYISKINDLTLFFGTLSFIMRIALWVFYSSLIFILGGEVAWFFEQKFKQHQRFSAKRQESLKSN